MTYIYAKHFRKLKDFTVTGIYAPYRSGGLKIDGKFIPRTFKYEGSELKEQKWNGAGFDLVSFDDKKDAEFYKTYKKVFDVKVKLGNPLEVETTKKELVTTDEFTINALGSFKVKEMLKADFDFQPKMDGEREAFDWEDDVYSDIVGRSFSMKVTGVGMDTSYMFKYNGKEKNNDADFPEGRNETANGKPPTEDLPFYYG